jgi:hypothetical protein
MFLLLIPICATLPAVSLAATPPVRSDSQAASLVSYSTFEPRPDNYTANHTMPTSSQLAHYRADAALSILWPGGDNIVGWVDGQFTGTTDEILQWGAYKWGFDPDLVRAIAADESWWHQYETGASVGILQIKVASFPAAYPMSLQSTAFNVDFKLAYQKACVSGYVNYLGELSPQGGHHAYPSPNATEQLWGCVGNWYSGGWYDSAAIKYIAQIQTLIAQKPWLGPYF